MRQTTDKACKDRVSLLLKKIYKDLNPKQVTTTIDNSRVLVEAEPKRNVVLLRFLYQKNKTSTITKVS